MTNSLENFKTSLFLVAFTCIIQMAVHCQAQVTLSDSTHERFIPVGNHKLFIRETGSPDAKFTVIFESGAGGGANDWTKVVSLLPKEIRTITYDRAGFGKSESGPIPQSMAQNVFELHELLKAVKIKGRIILVGQSMGGLIIRLYTEQFKKNIAGLVLVDPAHENSFLGSLKYGGWVRLREKAIGKPIPEPQGKLAISPGYDSTADYMAEEFQRMYLSSIKNPRQLGNLPLIILGAGIRKQPPGTPDQQWKELRAERDKQVENLTILSGNSKFILDTNSSHAIHYDNPAIVAQAIREIRTAVITKSKL